MSVCACLGTLTRRMGLPQLRPCPGCCCVAGLGTHSLLCYHVTLCPVLCVHACKHIVEVMSV